ncbi:hypothetical protein ABG752_02150 [Streptococcus iniae]
MTHTYTYPPPPPPPPPPPGKRLQASLGRRQKQVGGGGSGRKWQVGGGWGGWGGRWVESAHVLCWDMHDEKQPIKKEWTFHKFQVVQILMLLNMP